MVQVKSLLLGAGKCGGADKIVYPHVLSEKESTNFMRLSSCQSSSHTSASGNQLSPVANVRNESKTDLCNSLASPPHQQFI